MKTIKQGLTSIIATTLLGACVGKTEEAARQPPEGVLIVENEGGYKVTLIDHDGDRSYDELKREAWFQASYGSPIPSGWTRETYFKEGYGKFEPVRGDTYSVAPEFFAPYDVLRSWVSEIDKKDVIEKR